MTTTAAKHGVILSGGGANGAYEVGVLKALCAGKSPVTQYQPLHPDIFAGTSVGSYNAAFLVGRWDAYGASAVASLENIWLESISSSHQNDRNGVFRIRDNPLDVLHPLNFFPNPLPNLLQMFQDTATLAWDGFQRLANLVIETEQPLLDRIVHIFYFTSFVSLAPFRQTLQDTLWFTEIRRAPQKLLIITTNWELGTVKIYSNRDMTDQLGPSIILGSSAIPGIFPPTEIGSQLFVDGGVLLNTPLNPVIDAGAEVLHVISLFPNIDRIPLNGTGTLATMYRQQIIAWVHTLASNIKRVRDLNWALQFVGLASNAIQQLLEHTPTQDIRTAIRLKDIEHFLEQYQEYTPVTVHCYFPGDDISGPLGLLDFDYQRIKMLVERGFEDAISHDCTTNGCVIA